MNSLKYISLAAMLLILAGCAKDAQPAEETVEVSFSAAVPQTASTKADGAADVVVCAVYKDGQEIGNLRETVAVDGQNVVYSPRLVKNQTYDVVFWAMKTDAYNIKDMTNITRNTETAELTEEDFDAFCTSLEYEVKGGNATKEVTLKRPLARLNIGVCEEDWAAAENTGLTPNRIEITITGAYTGYNALEGKVNEVAQGIISSIVTGEEMTLNGTEEKYKKLSTIYLFANGNVDIEYTIFGKQSPEGVEELLVTNTITGIPVTRNFNTNLVGNLMSETVSFKIDIEEAIGGDANETIE